MWSERTPITNTYDLAGRLIKTAKPVVAGDPSTGDHQFFFDTAGRQFKESYPDGKEVIFQLDANSNVTKITYPDGYFVDRVYDQIDRLTDIKLNGSVTAAAHFDYDPRSRRTKLTYSNGAMIDYGYELDNDLASLVHTFVGSSATFSYLFSNAHKLLSEQTTDKQFNWSPSAVGTTTYQTANNLNQYPTVGGASFSYNTAGCLTGDSVWTYGFDTENHLLSASKAGTSLAFVYDPLERQTQKAVTTAGTAKTRYVYSGWQRIADYDGIGGALQNRYVYATFLDEPVIQVSAAGVLTFFHADQSGSIVATSSSTGAVTNKYGYGPFGETSAVAASGFGYTAQRFDAESGLYYFKYRIYAPAIGRFLQPDPVGYLAGLNVYAYVDNDPGNYNDPYGLDGKPKPRFPDKNYLPGGNAPSTVKPGYYVVRGHGMDNKSLGRHIADSEGPNAKRWDAKTVSKTIMKDPALAKAKAIVLESCNGARNSNEKLVNWIGDSSLGESIAKLTGKDTWAYKGRVTTDGHVYTDYNLNGTFDPGMDGPGTEYLFEGGTGKELSQHPVDRIRLGDYK